MDAVIDAQSEQDHKQDGRHRIESAQVQIRESECVDQTQKQRNSDHQHRDRCAYEKAEESLPTVFDRAALVVQILFPKEIEHHQEQHTSDSGAEAVEDVVHDGVDFKQVFFKAATEFDLHLGMVAGRVHRHDQGIVVDEHPAEEGQIALGTGRE